jgi:transposase
MSRNPDAKEIKLRKEILERIGKGILYREVATQLGLEKAKVSYVARKAGLKGVTGARRNLEKEKQIINAYKKGMLYREILKKFDVSSGTVCKIMNRVGLKRRNRI